MRCTWGLTAALVLLLAMLGREVVLGGDGSIGDRSGMGRPAPATQAVEMVGTAEEEGTPALDRLEALKNELAAEDAIHEAGG